MAAVKGQMTLTSSEVVRLVDNGSGTYTTGRYEIEREQGMDAMGVQIWLPKSAFSVQDLFDILHATGYLTV